MTPPQVSCVAPYLGKRLLTDGLLRANESAKTTSSSMRDWIRLHHVQRYQLLTTQSAKRHGRKAA